ncbi:hypothetical protein [Parafrankia sp. BMG5.11]|uniref:hypothetical protein n=1 Tax=Parafrankia sp. BMG5.11 TaxID=222540 RepID=UPI00103CA9FB|nr:hypothetical protein [Parafrankia sp. BMG5.11]TCJ41129.1 hypothetical protein E0504_00455 [Parafrankia sp. BMG5.11]
MSAPIPQSAFGLSSDDPILVTATLWRGAMVDRFAQIEFFIDRSLARCVAASIVPKGSDAILPRQRCKLLLKALSHPRLASKAAPARKSLQAVHAAWDERNGLCHGRIRPTGTAVSLHWTLHEKSGSSERTDRITPTDMLRKLSELDRLKTALGSQLGAIDKLCEGAAT